MTLEENNKLIQLINSNEDNFRVAVGIAGLEHVAKLFIDSLSNSKSLGIDFKDGNRVVETPYRGLFAIKESIFGKFKVKSVKYVDSDIVNYSFKEIDDKRWTQTIQGNNLEGFMESIDNYLNNDYNEDD